MYVIILFTNNHLTIQRETNNINQFKTFIFMKRDKELRERRNMAIFNRFNELLVDGVTHEAIYSLLEDEFYISSVTIKQIVLRISRNLSKGK